MRKVLSFVIFLGFSFNAVFGQLLDETRRLLQLQGIATQQQQDVESSVPPVVAPQPMYPTQPVSPAPTPTVGEQFEIKEPPERGTDKILPSDVIVIRTRAGNYVVGVDKAGYAELPIGVRHVLGLTPQKIEEMIFDATGEQVSVEVITSPKLSGTIQTIIPQYVSLLGDFMRPTISPPGSLGFCLGNAMGLNPTASGKLRIYSRGKVQTVDYYQMLKKQPEMLNIYIEPGSVIIAEKSSGWWNLESVGNVFARLRDVALTIIAWIELDSYGRQRGWW